MDSFQPARRCAFIDIGTNTILCLIADCGSGGDFKVLDDLAEITRLGQGARRGLSLAGGELLVIDIGGGSTELIRGSAAGVSDAVSIDVGSVRLTERFLHSDPVTQSECDAMAADIDAALAPAGAAWARALSELTLVGIAGTFTTLAAVQKKLERYSHGEVHGSTLSVDEVRRQIRIYQSRTVEQRKTLPGLHPMRADVILAGAYLIEKIMALVDAHELVVSDQGVRYGLLYEWLARKKSVDFGR
jgi:exopolyphosphatase/guanosine-5'-triphosphate,3'-diphosphate pyrophosphatase